MGGGEDHQKFKLDFGKGHTIFCQHCCSLKVVQIKKQIMCEAHTRRRVTVFSAGIWGKTSEKIYLAKKIAPAFPHL